MKLITQAVGATTRDKTLGRAEALRQAMLTMIDKGEAREAHPAYRAPFVGGRLVGGRIRSRPLACPRGLPMYLVRVMRGAGPAVPP